MEGERDRECERDSERERERDLEALWAGSGEGGVVDLLVLEERLATSFNLGEEPLPAGEPLWERERERERERLWDLAGLRERLGDRDGERPRERDRERERERDELSDLERLLDLQERSVHRYPQCILNRFLFFLTFPWPTLKESICQTSSVKPWIHLSKET